MSEKLNKATNEKLDSVVPKLVRLLGMLTSNADREVITAAHALLRELTNAGLDIHVLVSRIEHGKDDKEDAEKREQLSAAAMQKIYDNAYAKGHADGAELGRRSAVLVGSLPMGTFGSIASSNVGPGVNGHSWLEIAQYCANNKHRVSRDKDREFIDSIFEQIAYRQKTPSLPQAKWLSDIFNQRFAGRIE